MSTYIPAIAFLLFLALTMYYDRPLWFWLMLIALAFMLTGCAAAPRTWSKENRRLEAVYQTVHVVDLAQTLQIKNHPGLRESNWLLGPHPSDAHIATWYVVTAGGHALITSALEREGAPAWVCRTYQVLSILEAANAVRGNYQLGLHWGF